MANFHQGSFDFQILQNYRDLCTRLPERIKLCQDLKIKTEDKIEVFNFKYLSEHLAVSRTTLYKWCASCEFPIKEVEKIIRICDKFEAHGIK
jgi:hypothetical protein